MTLYGGGRGGGQLTYSHYKTPPHEETKEREVLIAMTTCGNANGRDDYEDQLNTVKTSSAISIGKVAKQELTDDRAKQCEEVDEQAIQVTTFGPVNESDGGKNDVGGK